MDVAVIKIDDIEYTIVDIIGNYTYLLDLENPNNFLIMRDEGEDLVSITDEDEYNRALKQYKDKIAG